MPKIIDFEKKGNVVRFYLGDDSCVDYTGDDWNDRPYEHNASIVYDEYVTGYIDVAAQFGCHVVAPEDEWRYRNNSPYCKDDFKRRTAPCLLIIPECVANEDEVHADSYLHHAGNENVVKFYFGDTLQHITNCKYFTVLYTWRKEGQT